MQKEPSMQAWTKAWHESDIEALKALYAEQASVFPPKKTTIKGNNTIVDYFKGGFGKVDVFFIPEYQEIKADMAFEFGIFQDKVWSGDAITETGKYAITWIKQGEIWQILCHTFSIGDPK
ncbi:MAG: nuclear transport factor 2 family protein [Bacteroidota bacterium]